MVALPPPRLLLIGIFFLMLSCVCVCNVRSKRGSGVRKIACGGRRQVRAQTHAQQEGSPSIALFRLRRESWTFFSCFIGDFSFVFKWPQSFNLPLKGAAPPLGWTLLYSLFLAAVFQFLIIFPFIQDGVFEKGP